MKNDDFRFWDVVVVTGVAVANGGEGSGGPSFFLVILLCGGPHN